MKMTKTELDAFLAKVEIIDDFRWVKGSIHYFQDRLMQKYDCPACGKGISVNVEYAGKQLFRSSHRYCGYCGNRNID